MPTQRDDDFLRQILLQEYVNAVQLYTNTIAVTFSRMYGFLAIHGGLIVGFFLVTEQFHRYTISIAGIIFAGITIAITEHIWQVSLFRITTLREIEKKLDRILPADKKPNLAIFNDQKTLLIDKKPVTFRLTGEKLPASNRAQCLIKVLPHQADRIIPLFLIILWVSVLVFTLQKFFN